MRKVILFVSLVIITLTLLLFSSCKTVEAWSYFVTINTFFFFWHRTCTNEIGWACGRCYELGHQQRIYRW